MSGWGLVPRTDSVLKDANQNTSRLFLALYRRSVTKLFGWDAPRSFLSVQATTYVLAHFFLPSQARVISGCASDIEYWVVVYEAWGLGIVRLVDRVYAIFFVIWVGVYEADANLYINARSSWIWQCLAGKLFQLLQSLMCELSAYLRGLVDAAMGGFRGESLKQTISLFCRAFAFSLSRGFFCIYWKAPVAIDSPGIGFCHLP